MKLIQRKLSIDTLSQRIRIKKRLRKGPATTIQLRREEDILMPAARIFELRHIEGLNIQSHWVAEPTEAGITHRVCLYVLHPGKWQGEIA